MQTKNFSGRQLSNLSERRSGGIMPTLSSVQKACSRQNNIETFWPSNCHSFIQTCWNRTFGVFDITTDGSITLFVVQATRSSNVHIFLIVQKIQKFYIILSTISKCCCCCTHIKAHRTQTFHFYYFQISSQHLILH